MLYVVVDPSHSYSIARHGVSILTSSSKVPSPDGLAIVMTTGIVGFASCSLSPSNQYIASSTNR